MSFQDYADTKQPRFRFGRISKPVAAGAVAIALVCMVFIGLTLSSFGGGFEIEKADASVEDVASLEQPTTPADIYVHVAGAVVHPGICKLTAGARVAEAVESAGGFTEDAVTESVNLARAVEDGEQIIVASVTEAAAEPAVPDAGSGGPMGSVASSGRININTATETDLQTISGIGPSKASKIVAYRESNGPFKTVDDLSNVSGIGQKTLESIRDQICVG